MRDWGERVLGVRSVDIASPARTNVLGTGWDIMMMDPLKYTYLPGSGERTQLSKKYKFL